MQTFELLKMEKETHPAQIAADAAAEAHLNALLGPHRGKLGVCTRKKNEIKSLMDDKDIGNVIDQAESFKCALILRIHMI